MRRALFAALLGTVLGALVLAGVGTFLLASAGAATDDARVLAQQVRRVAAEAPVVLAVRRPALRRRLSTAVRVAAGVEFAAVQPPAELVAGHLPAPLRLSDLPVRRLLAGAVVSGSLEGDVYAATSLPGVPASALATSGAPRFARAGPDAVVVVAAVRRIRGAGLGGGYLLLVSAAVLLVAAAVAALLSRRVTRPLAAAVAATERLAAGDLSVRLPPDQAYPELGTLSASINALAAALAESQARERQFLLAVSHDLRTPLTAIEGYAEAIRDGVAPDPAQAAAVIDAEARRLARLVEDLLDLARLGARRFSLRPERLGLGPLAAAAAEALRPTIEGLGLTLRLALPEGDPLVSVLDPDRARQVLANLLENAASYARRTVALAAWREPGPPAPGVVAVAVLDDGPGIAPADLLRVFEPLYRGQAPGRRVGTGLGLAICAELVAAMGGRIEARSPVPAELAGLLEAPGGPGTAMVVRFPGAPAPLRDA